jgi:hypothetical protein
MIQDLLFRDHRPENANQNEEAAMKRQADRLIIKIKDAELLERRATQLVSANGFPYAYPFNILSHQGSDILRNHYKKHPERGTLRWTESVLKLKPHTYRHSLDINRFFTVMQRGCWAQDIDLLYWRDDRQLAAIDRSQTNLQNIPDAFFILRNREGKIFTQCLEADRATESLYLINYDNDWSTKVERYTDWIRFGFQSAPMFANLPPPIVVSVTTGSERREAEMIKETAKSGGKGAYWFTTAAKLYADKDPNTFWDHLWQTPLGGEPRSLLDRLIPGGLS